MQVTGLKLKQMFLFTWHAPSWSGTVQSFLTCMLEHAGERIAVEADGPHHFTCNGLQPLGEMRARYRLLHARGWSVLSVPLLVWKAHPNDTAHQTFLKQVSTYAPSMCRLLTPSKS